jgi:hypothetical protein
VVGEIEYLIFTSCHFSILFHSGLSLDLAPSFVFYQPRSAQETLLAEFAGVPLFRTIPYPSQKMKENIY